MACRDCGTDCTTCGMGQVPRDEVDVLKAQLADLEHLKEKYDESILRANNRCMAHYTNLKAAREALEMALGEIHDAGLVDIIRKVAAQDKEE